ncbi:MAG: peptidoglycan-binding protein, partial [Halanaerobiales bacterium]|nr:peptidoglycan-binding protein [Halanaerobiales bacterium]
TGIKYPDSNIWVDYTYNNRNQLLGISGFIDGTVANPAFTYADNGFLTGVSYNNKTSTQITPDANSRVERITVTKADQTDPLMEISYAYDANNNVESRTNHLTGFTNYYQYDKLDRLKVADVEGTFYGLRTGFEGVAEEDAFGVMSLAEPKDNYWVKFDYKANSIGVVLVQPTSIGKIELKPDLEIQDHRIDKENISIFTSLDNFKFYKVPEDIWYFEKNEDGDITIIFEIPVEAMAFKIHSKYDDRDMYYSFIDKSEFYGDLRDMVKIYQQAESGKLEYDYDAEGNRTSKRTIVGNSEETTYEYYENSNLLKKATNNLTGEIFYYVYDENGNLIEKGNDFTENVDGTVTFITDGYKEYWRYEYTIKNRLKAVYLNEELQAEFVYDTDGMRIMSDVDGEQVTHYVFNQAGKVLFEVYDPVIDEIQAENNQTEVSYIYAYGRQIAKVEGIIGNSEEIVYYHHDNLGSTRLMTDKDGLIIWEQDYMPFGEDLYKAGTSVFEYEEEVEYKYTGQRQVKGIGLYYYGARFYDPEIGRFISEDTYQGKILNSQSQNIFIYVMNNPMRYVDPTGHNEIAIGDETVDTTLGTSLIPGEASFTLGHSVLNEFNLFLEKLNIKLTVALFDIDNWKTLKYQKNSLIKGDDVRELQQTLNFLGYLIEADGIFGSQTLQAVKAFQEDNGLNADGVVGRVSRRSFLELLGLRESESESLQLEYLAKTIYGEARGENWESKVAVGWVIRNRVDKNSWTYQETVTFHNTYGDYAFSCWDPTDVNYDNVMNPIGKVWNKSQEVAKGILNGDIVRPDLLKNIKHYYSPKAMIPFGSRPRWAKAENEIILEGVENFVFVRCK